MSLTVVLPPMGLLPLIEVSGVKNLSNRNQHACMSGFNESGEVDELLSSVEDAGHGWSAQWGGPGVRPAEIVW